jgi:uncharacterized OB-fold protein
MTDLSKLDVPGPLALALTEPFWRAAENGELILQKCGDCGRSIFYPRAICPHCWSDQLHFEKASGRGRLKAFSRVHKPGHPGWNPAAPYLIALVELVEGPTMLSHLITSRTQVNIGDRLRMVPTDVGGRYLPCFEVEDGS